MMYISCAGDKSRTWHVNEPFKPIEAGNWGMLAVTHIQADGHELEWVFRHFPQYCGKNLKTPVQYFFGDIAKQIAWSIRGNEYFEYDVVYADSTGA
jgi:hypothetical protein